MEYKVITEGNPLEVWAIFDSKERAEEKVKAKYWHQHMYDKDKHKTLIVVEYKK